MLRIAHLSDPHFGTEYGPALEALPLALRALRPDLLVLSGDLTQRARPREFRAAAAFLSALAPLPFLAVPGNHDLPLWDIWTRLLQPYRRFEQWIAPTRSGHWQRAGVEVFTFNSTSRWRHKNGLAPDWSSLRPGAAPGEGGIRLAVMHHPLSYRAPQDAANRIGQLPEVLGTLTAAEVDLVLGGHIHDPIIELSEVLYPQLPRSLVFSVAGTCLSARVRSGAPNSFNLIELMPGAPATMSIERWDLGVDGFRSVLQRRLRRRAQGGWVQE